MPDQDESPQRPFIEQLKQSLDAKDYRSFRTESAAMRETWKLTQHAVASFMVQAGHVDMGYLQRSFLAFTWHTAVLAVMPLRFGKATHRVLDALHPILKERGNRISTYLESHPAPPIEGE